MYKKIVVPVDCGQLDKGEKILLKAKSLLDEGGEILLLTVVEDMPGYLAIDVPVDIVSSAIDDGKTRLLELKSKTGIAARIEIRTGTPAREILAAADEFKADLVIVASHVPDLANYFIGATADRLVRHAKCSVLVDR
ncbi:universal stress protein [Rhizobium halophytocola]|uniref:Nucleotide-binding universal stress UspA family protein n=1 Tax=Rhizobium halophytocola TaxID=735519 RepID=A0ABS4DWV5_9HYPH|nr:universal stress protein [Rhizobium halophytocola]MBP1850152.1 nucleotide-binding universal stress UspA family protein [Rhizobium halophytocola]